jgi:hypothetical protein
MITKDYFEQDNIKVFDANISQNHLDYNPLGLDNLYAKKSFRKLHKKRRV